MSERESIEAGLSALSGALAAADAVALSRALLQAFDGEKGVGSAVKRAARTIRQSSETLRVAWEARVRGAIAASGGASVRRADLDEDAVWTALFQWLSGWSALPEGSAPERDVARTILAAMFPDGVSFVELTYALEWAEADRRVAMLDGDGFDQQIASLGGASMLGALRTAHTEYERVLGIGTPGGGDGASDAIGPLLDDARRELIAYVQCVRSSPAGEFKNEPQRTTLLAPLQAWGAHRTAREARRSRVAPPATALSARG